MMPASAQAQGTPGDSQRSVDDVTGSASAPAVGSVPVDESVQVPVKRGFLQTSVRR
jgi:hypothetical protein